ncbi:MAG: retropepsin-like aspartic protease family protein [Betaproteobacteria bacterium]
MPNFIALLVLLSAAFSAAAADVALIGVIGDKAAIVAVDGGDPKTIKVGQSWRGISVLAVEKDRATVEIDGKRQVLQRGMHYRATAAGPAGRQMVKLAADSRGHFIADGAINGSHIRFMVDTGASAIAIPGADAQRMGIDYRKGQRVTVQTAGGPTVAYAVRLDTVRLGAIELQAVDGFVVERGLNIALLGMTFLNRVEMKRDGPVMTLTRLF